MILKLSSRSFDLKRSIPDHMWEGGRPRVVQDEPTIEGTHLQKNNQSDSKSAAPVSHQVRFCKLRRESKLVVGAGRDEDQLQLRWKSFADCLLGCVALNTSGDPGGEEGAGAWSGHSGPTWVPVGGSLCMECSTRFWLSAMLTKTKRILE